MRILAYVHGAVPHLQAGSETMLYEMMRGLAEAGHTVAVVTAGTRPARRLSWRVGPVAHHARPGAGAADAFARAWRPEVVVTHHHFAPHVIGLARQVGAAPVAILHNDFTTSSRILAAGPDLVVCNTRWLSRKLNLPARGMKSIVVHPIFRPEDHRTTPGDRITIVNLYKIKGPEVFWRLARQMPRYQFLAVKGGYGPQVLRPGHANVEIIGTTTNMRDDVWARTRVLLVPSRYESYGRVAVEACASGIPVIAAPTPGLRESLGRGGIFISRTNASEWHRRVRTLMDNPAAWRRASAAATARAEQLDWQAEIAAWVRAVAALPLPGGPLREHGADLPA